MKFREHLRVPRSYFLWKWQKKADAFEKALQKHKWRTHTNPRYTCAGFFDTDILDRVDLFDRLGRQGMKLFLYPHAARPSVFYAWRDVKPHPNTEAHFVVTEGHAEIMRQIGYTKPLHPVGWSYCEIKPFQPRTEIKNVLWGPLHPNRNGWMHYNDKEVNRRAFARLKQASKDMGFHLTIRYLHTLEENGLPGEPEPGVTYVPGLHDNSFVDIDRADVVVGHQTFAYIAVARGKPTLMMDEWMSPRCGNTETNFAYIDPDAWKRIQGLMMYPHDINTTSDVCNLIQYAASTDEDIVEWRDRMIGKPFQPKLFVETLESYFE